MGVLVLLRAPGGSQPYGSAEPLGPLVQLAPYNTHYERLSVHMAAAGVAAEPNLWDHPATLARAHAHASPDSEASMAPGKRSPALL